MDADQREGIIRRILGLMAKTVDNGATEEEAMSAADAVARLLNKYQLDLSDIELRESKCIDGKQDTRQKQIQAIDSVITAIGFFTDTKVWRSPGEGSFGGIMYHFYGLEHDVLVAEYIYKLCDRAIVWGWEDHKRRINFGSLMASQKGKVKDSFQHGMAHRLAERLREMKREQKRENLASTGRDLVVVKSNIVEAEFAKNLGIDLRAGKQGKQVRNDGHYQSGRAEGERVALNPGVTRDSMGAIR